MDQLNPMEEFTLPPQKHDLRGKEQLYFDEIQPLVTQLLQVCGQYRMAMHLAVDCTDPQYRDQGVCNIMSSAILSDECQPPSKMRELACVLDASLLHPQLGALGNMQAIEVDSPEDLLDVLTALMGGGGRPKPN